MGFLVGVFSNKMFVFFLKGWEFVVEFRIEGEVGRLFFEIDGS